MNTKILHSGTKSSGWLRFCFWSHLAETGHKVDWFRCIEIGYQAKLKRKFTTPAKKKKYWLEDFVVEKITVFALTSLGYRVYQKKIPEYKIASGYWVFAKLRIPTAANG